MYDPEDPRGYSDETLDAMRRRAVAGHEAGYSAGTLAEILGFHRDTVYRWLAGHRERGERGLPGRRTGCPIGASRILKPEQEAELRRIVAEETPHARGIAAATWTRRAVAELVDKVCGVALPERTVGEYLRRWGMTNKRAARLDRRRDPEEVEAWLRDEFPAIQAKAAAEGAALLFLDETGVDSMPTPMYGYAPAGATPTVEMDNQRYRTNLVSAIGADGTLDWATYDGTLTGERFVARLEELLADEPRKVHLVLDKHPAHTAVVVREWAAGLADRIELHELPAHAPDLNPVEYLNHDLKAQVYREGYPDGLADLKGKVWGFMRRLAAAAGAAARYFLHPKAQYAA